MVLTKVVLEGYNSSCDTKIALRFGEKTAGIVNDMLSPIVV